MKYAWIAGQREAYPLPAMCTTLGVSSSGYRAWQRGGRTNGKRLSNTQLLALIRALHAELKGAYGSPRMVREIRARGFPASKERVERLMRENGIRARHKRRYKATTDSKHGLPVAPNVLDRDFAPAAPNQVWTADPGHCARPVQPRSRRLVDQAANDGRHRRRCVDHGLVPPQTGAGADPSL
jgi:putative transposase